MDRRMAQEDMSYANKLILVLVVILMLIVIGANWVRSELTAGAGEADARALEATRGATQHMTSSQLAGPGSTASRPTSAPADQPNVSPPASPPSGAAASTPPPAGGPPPATDGRPPSPPVDPRRHTGEEGSGET